MINFVKNIYQDMLLWINPYFAQFLIVFIFLAFLLFVPVVISIIFPLIKKKIEKHSKVYLYAFTTGFFLIMSTFGFMREALETSSVYAAAYVPIDSENFKNYIYAYNILLVGGGVFFGLLSAFLIKYIISYRINKKLRSNKHTQVFVHEHNDENGDFHVHKHPDYIFNSEDSSNIIKETLTTKVESKLKIIALILLLTHRVPEGLLLGYNINLLINGQPTSLSYAFIVSLVLHLIPEEIIFYFRLRESGFSKQNSFFISLLGLFFFLPFMLIGNYAGKVVADIWELRAFIFAFIGGIFLFTSLVEFFPEFYHYHMNKNQWFYVLLFLFIGVIFAVIILSIHTHKK
ncbi:ZIP family metal transporter [Mycoplasmopsis cricetuli]|uniref:ZIP family metal transporter n=1 Tax=Mycoplasmopsis cricetuli TaxID=171283 RepID=UPI001FE20528|nr:ZIP family metal transporter [Mycoplasmopsis cricetuli]